MRARLARVMCSLAWLAAGACAQPVTPRPPPVWIADVPPPPIQGGDLLLVSDGTTLVVSDADRDRVLVFDLAERRILRTLMLDAGAEPGRAVESPGGMVHVVLRGTGSVVSFEVADTETPIARDVCAMPSGIAYDETQARVLVACVSGELVSFIPNATVVSSSTFVQRDLRDVIAHDGHVYVTTLRAAHILELDRASGAVLRQASPPDSSYADARGVAVPFRAAVAWRTLFVPGLGLAMLHQRARESSIVVHVRSATLDAGVAETGAISPDAGALLVAGSYTDPAGSIFDAGFSDAGPAAAVAAVDCGAIVRAAITLFEPTDLHPSGGSATIADARLAVDLAVTGLTAAVASAGVAQGRSGVHELALDATLGLYATDGCARSLGSTTSAAGAATSVIYDRDGRIVAFEREPAAIVIGGERVLLGGASRLDTGHQLFHTTTDAGIACASCHPGGGEDGRIWDFDGSPRRTESLWGGVLATAPFHWDGDEATFRQLVDDVFTHRMSGPVLDDEHVAALGSWIDQLPAPHGPTNAPGSASNGRAIFVGRGQCTTCHAGSRFTRSEPADVGAFGGLQQVPSLVGVSFRLPVMRTGCATTLADRFTMSCGGAAHGLTGGFLSPSDVTDLVAYLETL